ncbi:MAG: class I SAM-dependent methyltransferase [Gammaproteobacteria bacterium]|nr:class I SAM-dependent methyltransferase [Gammaproteobacteria bacterium]MBU1624032.1 class I SAM-dependent methyltransferase [Gammaproteobacteria bacterium]MBU1981760.1 class I SAM-dependent methyltransferase [Gammaproteobacteria bacterium]
MNKVAGLQKMASCDAMATVYISHDAVYRVIDSASQKSVEEMLEVIRQLGEGSIVHTEVCSEIDVPDGIDDSLFVLKHKKVMFISYPHEWCAAMLKDAALCQTALSKSLLRHGLFLKDAHPWNILFEKGRPIFVDFTSIVTREQLFSEEYLRANQCYAGATDDIRLAQVLKEIAERMYLPYFFNPLCAYAFGHRPYVANEIERSTLNASRSKFSIRSCLPVFRLRPSAIISSIKWLIARLRFSSSIRLLEKSARPERFFQRVEDITQGLEVQTSGSAYSNYYQLKGEDQSWDFSQDWNGKQKAVYEALNTPKITTVLDVACNTGWYSILAAKLGKQVVAFDIDEACIEALYGRVKAENLNILPLVMNFSQLSVRRDSIYDGKTILIDSSDRLSCDSLMALGIFHHLTLGAGMSFEKVLEHLISLCKHQMIIEFVDAEDAMIKNEPEFFPAYFKNKELLADYSVRRLVALCEERGFRVRQESSHPATRSILICER